MDIRVKDIVVKDYLTKSNLPASDYVINPYIGCTNACKYCYACFMKRFTKHTEEWGSFIDIKHCDKPININKIGGKSIFLSSVTDCYNAFEENCLITRKILEQLVLSDAAVTIATKSSLIRRDIDLLKKFKDIKVAMSINTLNEEFRLDMDRASSIQDRLATLRELHKEGIYTVLFMSPIFPYITDFKEIIEASREFIDEYWFENLNLRGSYKSVILDYINKRYPSYILEYENIYLRGDKSYWEGLALEMDTYCLKNNVKYINYFYHEKLVEEKKASRKTV